MRTTQVSNSRANPQRTAASSLDSRIRRPYVWDGGVPGCTESRARMTGIGRDNAPYRRFARVYDALLGDESFSEMRQAFALIQRRHSVRFTSAADIGCGTGTFVDYLCRIGSDPVWGVDLSPQMLEVAARKNSGNRARFLLQDMRRLRLPPRPHVWRSPIQLASRSRFIASARTPSTM